MTVQDFVRILRTRWLVVCVTFAVAVLGALGYSLLGTPLYQASTLLFVSTSSEGDNTEANDGDLFAQRRVLSYIELLMSEVVAQRTVDSLGLDMSASDLQSRVEASAPTDTVLIYVTVTDPSPEQARDIANTLSDEFAVMAAGLETPRFGVEPNARVMVEQRAETPDASITPKTSRNLAIAGMLGLVLGIVIALVRDRLDGAIRRAATVESVTGVGVIADIPFDERRRKDPLISFGSDHSPIADAFRDLRVNLQFLEVTDGPRVIVVASSMAGEGRTTTAVNLAQALAQSDYNVAVVDADLRRPRVASYLGVPAEPGLTTVLTGAATLQESLQETRLAGVSVLTSGAVLPSPTELLGSPATKDVLSTLGSQFDYVIVDSPSLRTIDAAIVARSAQGVLVLARLHRTKRKRLAAAVDVLGRAGTTVIGVVLTMTHHKDAADD